MRSRMRMRAQHKQPTQAQHKQLAWGQHNSRMHMQAQRKQLPQDQHKQLAQDQHNLKAVSAGFTPAAHLMGPCMGYPLQLRQRLC